MANGYKYVVTSDAGSRLESYSSLESITFFLNASGFTKLHIFENDICITGICCGGDTSNRKLALAQVVRNLKCADRIIDNNFIIFSK